MSFKIANMFKSIFLKENMRILIKISLIFFSKDPIDNRIDKNLALV